jgi:protocatechuate 3,4-dioxygenase beta subunit
MSTTTPQQALLDNVLATFGNIDNPRLKEVVAALVRHLHAFADEVKLTHQEWEMGIQFLTACGQKSDQNRQEVILLSDILGLSSLVEMLDYHGSAAATEQTVLGPFHVDGSVARNNGDSIIETETGGRRLHVGGTVRDEAGKPIAGARVDVWQTANNGFYPMQDPAQDPQNMRGIFTTDAEGNYSFLTTRPVDYSVPTDGPVGRLLDATGRTSMRAAHTHLIVSAPGFYPVTTHIFDSQSAYLKSDAVFGVRDSLVREFEDQPDGSLRTEFDVTLTSVR